MKRIAIFVMVAVGACAAPRDEHTSVVMAGLCQNNPTRPCCPGSPIVLDLEGDGFRFTSAEDGVEWTLHPGELGRWGWTRKAFLVLDRNHNGWIDDGTEMFGDQTPQPQTSIPNGFNALSLYDLAEYGGNGDGAITPADAAWPNLRLWSDDGDAFSAPGELASLDDRGVHAISLDAQPSDEVDEHGNESRFVARIAADYPVASVAKDVWLVQAPVERPVSAGMAGDAPEWTCTAWIYAFADVPGPPYAPCVNPYTGSDPVGPDNLGGQYTLVARSANRSTKQAALDRVTVMVTTALDGPPACVGTYPSPDNYSPPPYTETPEGLHYVCSSHVVKQGPNC